VQHTKTKVKGYWYKKSTCWDIDVLSLTIAKALFWKQVKLQLAPFRTKVFSSFVD